MGQWAYHWVWLDFYVPVWPNLVASLIVYVFVLAKIRALRKLHEELKELHARQHAEHMAALNLDTPGGLAVIVAEVRDAKAAAESAHAAVKTLTAVRGQPAPPWRKT